MAPGCEPVGLIDNTCRDTRVPVAIAIGVWVSTLPVVGLGAESTGAADTLDGDPTFTSPAAVALVLILVIGVALLSQVLRLQRQHKRDSDQLASLTQALHASQTTNRSLCEASNDAILMVDQHLRIESFNAAALILFNCRQSDIVDLDLQAVVRLWHADGTRQELDVRQITSNLSQGATNTFSVSPASPAYADLVLQLTLSTRQDIAGLPQGHVLVLRDISREKRLQDRLDWQSEHDALTGCLTRAHFERRLAGLVDGLAFDEREHALIQLDIDRFHIINDTCGHRAGDRLLTELTTHLKTILRSDDLLVRLGGDEFALLLLDIDAEHLDSYCTRLSRLFQRFVFRHEEHAFAVNASIGVVALNAGWEATQDLMAAADIACHTAKEKGRNGVHHFSRNDALSCERTEELSWLPPLQTALATDAFCLLMQPLAKVTHRVNTLGQMSAKAEIAHFEFLLRLPAEDGTNYTPWQFMRAAERYDLMKQIDRWVIRQAVKHIAELQGGPDGRYSYSINLSSCSTGDEALGDYIREQYESHSPDPSRIWFEVTEAAATANFSVASELFRTIKSLGSQVALDDFGAGYSSLAFLRSLPVDVLKIDGNFIRRIDNSKFDRHLVQAVQHLSDTLGIATVAEHVDSEAALQTIAEIGIQYAQGFLIGHPVSIEQTRLQHFQRPLQNCPW